MDGDAGACVITVAAFEMIVVCWFLGVECIVPPFCGGRREAPAERRQKSREREEKREGGELVYNDFCELANSKRNKKTIDSNYLAMTGYSRVRRSESSKKKSKKKRSYKV